MMAAEFERIAERLGPCELVGGEVVTLSPGDYEHNQAVSNAFGLLREWARQQKVGRVLTNETGLIVQRQPDTVRGVDVVYYSYERLPQGSAPRGFQTTPPNLVAEAIGKGQGWREMVEKVGEYLRMGVDVVWVIEPKSQRVHVYHPDVEPVVLNRGDTLADPAGLPGFHCKVEELFAD